MYFSESIRFKAPAMIMFGFQNLDFEPERIIDVHVELALKVVTNDAYFILL